MYNFNELTTAREIEAIIMNRSETRAIYKKKKEKEQIYEINEINDDTEEEKQERKEILYKNMRVKKELSERTVKDHEKINERRKSCKNTYEKVKNFLRYLSGKWQIGQIRETAKLISVKSKINIDRLAKRYNECLICWFCENWSSLSPHLIEYSIEQLSGTDSDSNSRLLNALSFIKEITLINKNNSLFQDEIIQKKSGDQIKIEFKQEIKKEKNLAKKSKTNSVDDFFLKMFDENFDSAYSFDEEFPGLYKEFY